MPATEDRAISEFPRALQLLATALIEVSNPDGLGAYDTNSVELTEVGKVILGVQYTQQLGNVSVFDAIKNTRVLSGTTTPLANEGANGQLYVKYQTVSNVDNVVGMYFKKDGVWLEISLGGGGGSSTLAGLSDVDLTSPTDGQLLRYNGTSGKWENAGIINDTTASASSVYSSNKVNSELALKQNATDNSLDTTKKTVVGAINEVRNYNNLINKPTIPTKTSDLTNDSGFTVVTTVSWGTSITIKYIKSNFLLFISNQLFVLWFYGGGYANVDIRNTGTNDVASGAGTVTLGNITVTRTSDGFTVTTGTANATISVIG